MAEIKELDIPLQEKPIVINESQPLKEKLSTATESQPLTPTPDDTDDISWQSIASAFVLYSTVIIIFFSILAIVPIIQIIIGALYKDECPVSPNIPISQIVTGSIELANIILGLILIFIFVVFISPTLEASKKNSESAAVGLGIGLICLFGWIVLIITVASIFLGIWYRHGFSWLTGSWSTVQYANRNLVTYCNPVMYRFHFWLFVYPFIFGFGICCICCCAAACRRRFATPTKSNPEPTTQP